MSNTTIIIQGPTNYYQQILENLSPNQKYIWSKWDDEPKKNLESISHKIELIISKKPYIYGHGNINLQCLSTINGIKKCKSDFIFKTRSDIIYNNIDKLIDRILVNNKELSFIQYGHWNNIPQILDFILFGSIENSIKFWDVFSQDKIYIPPETILTQNYRTKYCNNEKMDIFLKRFYFFNHLLNEKELDFYWLKLNRIFSKIQTLEDDTFPKSC